MTTPSRPRALTSSLPKMADDAVFYTCLLSLHHHVSIFLLPAPSFQQKVTRGEKFSDRPETLQIGSNDTPE